jgi:hypothetical protein
MSGIKQIAGVDLPQLGHIGENNTMSKQRHLPGGKVALFMTLIEPTIHKAEGVCRWQLKLAAKKASRSISWPRVFWIRGDLAEAYNSRNCTFQNCREFLSFRLPISSI